MQTLNALLNKPGLLLGTHLTIPHVNMVEILAAAGFDYLIIDTQHVTVNPETAEMLVLACAKANVTPFVRVAENNAAQICSAFDMGAAAVIVPLIETAEQAQAAVDAAKYGPTGVRSACPFVRQAGLYNPDWPSHADQHDNQCGIFALVETRKGLENVEAIAAVPGLRGMLCGVVDLAVDMGHKGNQNHPEVLAGVDRAIAATRANGIEMLKGVHAIGQDAANTIVSHCSEQGVRLFWAGNPTLFIHEYARNYLKNIRAGAKASG